MSLDHSTMNKYVPYLFTILLLLTGQNIVAGDKITCTCSDGTTKRWDTYFYRGCTVAAKINYDFECRAWCPFHTYGTTSCDSSRDCVGESTLLYSCSKDAYVNAGSVRVGDSIRTMTPEGPKCSDTFYKYQHEGKYEALSFNIEGSESALVFSKNHLLYVGEEFGKHRPTYAKNIQIGDKLVSNTAVGAGGSHKKVISIAKAMTGLVNVLTLNPTLELEGGVIVSAYSYDETLYAIPFVPFKIMYHMFGAEYMRSVLEKKSMQEHLTNIDYYMGYSIDFFSL